jgi:hypothetical protein
VTAVRRSTIGVTASVDVTDARCKNPARNAARFELVFIPTRHAC